MANGIELESIDKTKILEEIAKSREAITKDFTSALQKSIVKEIEKLVKEQHLTFKNIQENVKFMAVINRHITESTDYLNKLTEEELADFFISANGKQKEFFESLLKKLTTDKEFKEIKFPKDEHKRIANSVSTSITKAISELQLTKDIEDTLSDAFLGPFGKMAKEYIRDGESLSDAFKRKKEEVTEKLSKFVSFFDRSKDDLSKNLVDNVDEIAAQTTKDISQSVKELNKPEANVVEVAPGAFDKLIESGNINALKQTEGFDKANQELSNNIGAHFNNFAQTISGSVNNLNNNLDQYSSNIIRLVGDIDKPKDSIDNKIVIVKSITDKIDDNVKVLGDTERKLIELPDNIVKTAVEKTTNKNNVFNSDVNYLKTAKIQDSSRKMELALTKNISKEITQANKNIFKLSNVLQSPELENIDRTLSQANFSKMQEDIETSKEENSRLNSYMLRAVEHLDDIEDNTKAGTGGGFGLMDFVLGHLGLSGLKGMLSRIIPTGFLSKVLSPFKKFGSILARSIPSLLLGGTALIEGLKKAGSFLAKRILGPIGLAFSAFEIGNLIGKHIVQPAIDSISKLFGIDLMDIIGGAITKFIALLETIPGVKLLTGGVATETLAIEKKAKEERFDRALVEGAKDYREKLVARGEIAKPPVVDESKRKSFEKKALELQAQLIKSNNEEKKNLLNSLNALEKAYREGKITESARTALDEDVGTRKIINGGL